MAPATIASDICQPLDIHGNFPPAITLNNVLFLDDFANTVHIVPV
jgi:hypothetical protein